MQNHVLNDLYAAATKCPDKLAYSDGEHGLTFGQVYDQSQRIGSYLHRAGIYKQPVVVFMRKSPDEIAAFFGVIAGGCFYVPIDEEMPQSRIQLILDNVQTPLIICDTSTFQMAQQFQLSRGTVVQYEALLETPVEAEALACIHARAIDTDPVYIVFTSGSTGIPKGVAACHRSVLDYITQLSEVLEFDENTVFGNQSPLYFDACLKEL